MAALAFLGVGSMVLWARTGETERVVEARAVVHGPRGKDLLYVLDGSSDVVAHSWLCEEIEGRRARILFATTPALSTEDEPDPSRPGGGPGAIDSPRAAVRGGGIHSAQEARVVAQALASALAPTPQAALRALEGSALIDGEAGRKGRDRAWYEALAQSPNLVCVARYGRLVVATTGPEPADRNEFWRLRRAKRLDRAGRGFALVDVFGETSVTHCLSCEEIVPEEFAGLFRPTHLRVTSMTDAEEGAHWGFDPWADLREAA